jgi:hypothetical protein
MAVNLFFTTKKESRRFWAMSIRHNHARVKGWAEKPRLFKNRSATGTKLHEKPL